MGDYEIIIRGRFLNANAQERRELVLEAYKEMAESLKEAAITEIERSAELNSYIGINNDPEAIRAILRSIKVEVTNSWPPDLEIKFDDDLGHWFGGKEIPQEVAGMIKKMFDIAATKWSMAGYPDEALRNMMAK